jgi:hypothetical protein
MASEFSQSNTIPSSFSIPITENLSKTNYRLWRAQILLTIRVAQMEELLTGDEKMLAKMVSVQAAASASMSTKPNPDYVRWLARDQVLLGYLLSLVTREVLMGITMTSSSGEAWSTLKGMYGS